MSLCPLPVMVELPLLEASFSGGLGGIAPQACLDITWGMAQRCASPTVHHRGPPSLSPWKTQCAQRVQSWLDACPWNVKASTRCGQWSCAGLGARPGECGGCPLVGQGHCSLLVVIPAQPVAAATDRRRWDCSGWKVLQRQR
jgi:hypothetical protein